MALPNPHLLSLPRGVAWEREGACCPVTVGGVSHLTCLCRMRRPSLQLPHTRLQAVRTPAALFLMAAFPPPGPQFAPSLEQQFSPESGAVCVLDWG